MRKRSKAIALLVAATLFIEMTLTPSAWMVYATEEPDASENSPEHFLSEEKVTEKGSNYTIFDNQDGTETLIHTTEYTYDKIGCRTSETRDGDTYNHV